MMFQVYQFRHCDVTNTAHQVFLAIGVALILEVVGIFYSHWFFWTIFIVIYISFVVIFIIQVSFPSALPDSVFYTLRCVTDLLQLVRPQPGGKDDYCAGISPWEDWRPDRKSVPGTKSKGRKVESEAVGNSHRSDGEVNYSDIFTFQSEPSLGQHRHGNILRVPTQAGRLPLSPGHHDDQHDPVCHILHLWKDAAEVQGKLL